MVDGEVHFKVVMCKALFGLHHIEEWRRFADPSLDHCKLFPQAVKGLKLEYLEVRILMIVKVFIESTKFLHSVTILLD